MFPKQYKDQNDRIAKIYRFKTPPDDFVLKNEEKYRDWEKSVFHHASLFLSLNCGTVVAHDMLAAERSARGRVFLL